MFFEQFTARSSMVPGRLDEGVLRGASAHALRSALQGRRFAEPWRHGKWLIAPTGGPALAMHFGMTGALVTDGSEHRHDRVVFVLDDRALRYRDMRKLTGIHLALMDQGVIAGLGNLLVDEILWRARLHPGRRTGELDHAALSELHARMRSVLRTAALLGEVPARRSWLIGHREDDGGRCPRCGTRLEHSKVGGRATVCCPRCQPRALNHSRWRRVSRPIGPGGRNTSGTGAARKEAG